MRQLKRLLSALAPFTPTLVGTYPLGLQTSSSDLDLICYCPDLAQFERALSAALLESGLPPTPPRRVQLALEASVTNVNCEGFPVEVFCQPIPVAEQHGFRHMIVEGRLLQLGGERLRARVLALRAQGLKTEPAFANALGLTGDAYAALLCLESQSQSELTAMLSDRGLL